MSNHFVARIKHFQIVCLSLVMVRSRYELSLAYTLNLTYSLSLVCSKFKFSVGSMFCFALLFWYY